MASGELMRIDTEIDWAAPWFVDVVAAYRAIGGAAGDWRARLSDTAARAGVVNARGLPIRFVAADAAGGAPYESHIARTGEVPTRDNRHDLFNALVWLALPRTKARLNALQAAAIAAGRAGATRGAVRDATTLIDENAVLLVTQRADLADALRRHDWTTLFIAARSAWQRDVRTVVLGHALLDKLVTPFKSVTAHAVIVPLAADATLPAVDAWAASALDATWTPRRLLPLPVCGIPGWAVNDDPAFYADPQVFRPERRFPPADQRVEENAR